MNGKINRMPAEPTLALPREDLTWVRAKWLADGAALDEKTLESYANKTGFFVTWWQAEGGAHQWQLTKRALQTFSNWLAAQESRRKNKLSYNTRKAIVNHVMALLQWGKRAGFIVDVDFTGWFPTVSGQPPTRKAATADQLTSLLAATADSRYPLRDQAILAFFIGTGCRLCEVAGLTVADVQFMADGSGTAIVTGKRTAANKSGRRSVAFDSTCGQYLLKYLDWEQFTAGPMWMNEHGAPFAQAGIYRMVARTVERAKLGEVVKGCHDLRRAFATILGMMHPDSPAWADMIRRQLGHKHYSQTALYTLYGAEDIRERLVSPLNRKNTDSAAT